MPRARSLSGGYGSEGGARMRRRARTEEILRPVAGDSAAIKAIAALVTLLARRGRRKIRDVY